MFQTRQGYLTAPGPATSWTASGAKRAVVTNIPTGPSNVTARILCFTGAGGDSFFYVGSGASLFSGNMIISDNTTTSITVDFSDAILLAGTNVDNMFRLVELGDSAGVIDYSERLFWWGERNRITQFRESQLRRRLHRTVAAALSARLDCPIRRLLPVAPTSNRTPFGARRIPSSATARPPCADSSHKVP